MPKSKQTWQCRECGRKYTLKQAERAMAKGCAAGCSGIDIEEIATTGMVIDLMAELKKSLANA